MPHNNFRLVQAALLAVSLAACQSYNVTYEPPATIATPEQDSGPERVLAVDHIPDALPVVEPRTKAGNVSPYTVAGKTYRVLESADSFSQTGYASWYGKKFHGRKTSNGEIYNMYGMTAAHKTLPIPTFVRVTNLENNKSVIVRVNDRGPFHSDRIIDLTYTAARKLGFAQKGTAKVRVEVVNPEPNSAFAGLQPVTEAASASSAPKPANPGGYEIPEGTYLQMGAFSTRDSAYAFAQTVAGKTTYPVKLESVPNKSLFRVLLGPLRDNWDLVNLQIAFTQQGFQEPKVVYRAQ